MTTNEQLELGFNGLQASANGRRHPDRMVRAAWWFGQMRRRVANAIDWQTAGQTHARQTWFNSAQSK
jgi:hypothetical protein